MKRFIAVLSGLLVLPAFAEVAPVFYDGVIEYSDEEPSGEEIDAATETVVVAPVAQPSSVNPRTANRNASRAVPSTASANVSSRANAGRVTASNRTTSNAVTARTATNASARGTVSRVSTRAARSATNGTQQIATTRRAMQTAPTTAARASIVQTDTVNTPLYTGRVSSRASAVRARIPTISSKSSNVVTTAESAADATQTMDELAQITDFCKAQYTSCMDNFCNVLDDNQGRCSCSKNIKNYAKTEEALKAATEALQDVAQQIQYIGLSADEIETLFTQTEAEIQMQSTQDNTQLKNDLDRIKNLIVDVKGGSASTVSDAGMGFDLSGLLDFSIDSTGFDLASLFGTTTADTSSISNQRGETLYKTAATRCKAAVLNSCAAQGVDISVITNSYDLEIDKQCIAYERSLTDTNEEMNQTVRNAKGVLQRARLMVAQQKNSYDLRGCVNALDSCMQDDYVCGTDYEYCLDPTGKYIVDGEIVVGSTPGYIPDPSNGVPVPGTENSSDTLYNITWKYDTDSNAWTGDGTLSAYIEDTVPQGVSYQDKTDNVMSKYLLHKIGYNKDGKNIGMCISVLNKCQDYTYQDKVYQSNNIVVKDYLQRTLTKIKVAQDKVISDYAEKCISDVSSCLSSNNYDNNNNIAINACRAQIVTCMSVNGDATKAPTPASMKNWIALMVGTNNEQLLARSTACTNTGGTFAITGEYTGSCTCSGGATYNSTTYRCDCPSGQEFNAETKKCEATGS
ncbi:MAG: hypothetical protein IKA25_01580 [Alphaproteobacteria bacterium]|nr:hypothetical protein [Alphaproteobacteria bacterium]